MTNSRRGKGHKDRLITLPDQTLLGLRELGKKRTKSFYVLEALNLHLEDLEDFYLAEKAHEDFIRLFSDQKTCFPKHLAKKGIEIDENKLKDHRKKIIARRKKTIPFILMHSKSTQRDFPLFLEKEEFPIRGPGKGFNFYGLSNREAPVAVPVF